MRAKILAGAVVALMYGTVALAEGDCPPKQDTQAQLSEPQSEQLNPDVSAPSEQQNEAAIGGAGQVGQESQAPQQQSQGLQNEQAVGGSGQGEVLLRCTPANNAAIGGSGQPSSQLTPSEQSMAPAPAPAPAPALAPPPAQPEVKYEEKGTGGSGMEEKKPNLRGLAVTVGGGIEGYTNALAPQVNPGPAATVTASLRPTSVLGIEVGYTGSALNIDNGTSGGARGGPDIIRNGGQAVATVGLMASSLQPYVLGGIGVSRYNVRAGFSEGFRDDTVGQVPLGVGLRTQMGNFTADARVNYNLLFDQEFAANVPATDVGAPGDSEFSKGGSYLGTLNVGLMF